MPVSNILIVDDHPLMRFALTKLLESTNWPGLNIYQASGGNEAIDLLKYHPEIEVMLLDISMPDMNGVEVMRALQKNKTAPATLVLSQFETPDLVSQMIKLGVKGFLVKDIAMDDLLDAIETTSRGEFYDNSIFQEWRKYSQAESHSPNLTLSPRESDLLHLLKQGKSNKEIAAYLSLSLRTIESYRKKLMARTKTKSVAQLISLFLEAGQLHMGNAKRPETKSQSKDK